jgi:hypothetical protein
VRVTTTFSTHGIEYRFRCAHCSHTQQAMITATGVGSSSAFNSAGTGAARAGENAVKLGEQTLAFVPCPKCGKANDAEARRIRTKTFATLIGLPALICYGAIGGWMFLNDPDMASEPTVWLILTGLFLFVSGFAYFFTPKPWSRAAERTRFLDAPG